MTHTQPEKTGGLSTHRSNPCLFFLNQEKAAIKSLVGLAEGYRAHFHPVSQLKKQVSLTRAIGTGVHGSCPWVQAAWQARPQGRLEAAAQERGLGRAAPSL